MKSTNFLTIKNDFTSDVVIFVRANDSLVWSLPVWLICKTRGIPVRLECCVGDEFPADGIITHLAPRVRIGAIVVSQLTAILETLDERYPSAGIWPTDRESRAYCRDTCYGIVEICTESSPFAITLPDVGRVCVDSTLLCRLESMRQEYGDDSSNGHDTIVAVATLLPLLKINGVLDKNWHARLGDLVNSDAARAWSGEQEVQNRIKNFETTYWRL